MVSKKRKAKNRKKYAELLRQNNPAYLLPDWVKKEIDKKGKP
jgi:hypothetical protein